MVLKKVTPTLVLLLRAWTCGASLLAHYSFNDGSATESTDSSLDGTISGATATTARRRAATDSNEFRFAPLQGMMLQYNIGESEIIELN